MIKVAIQGQIGSFHHEAANKFFSGNVDLVCLKTFSDVFKAVETGAADFGVSAIENNLHGSINEVYRLLDKYDVWINKDTRLHINQNLIGYKKLDLDSLEDIKVISHPVALTQVNNWLENNFPNAQKLERADTAGSVEEVMSTASDKLFAVAGVFAAKHYKAEILAKNIQDDPENYTRFILFSQSKNTSSDADHCSIILTTSHNKGALLNALKIFDKYNCNLTKLDSHPIAGDKQHYNFYIDYELPKNNQKLISDLELSDCRVKILGEYKRLS